LNLTLRGRQILPTFASALLSLVHLYPHTEQLPLSIECERE